MGEDVRILVEKWTEQRGASRDLVQSLLNNRTRLSASQTARLPIQPSRAAAKISEEVQRDCAALQAAMRQRVSLLEQISSMLPDDPVLTGVFERMRQQQLLECAVAEKAVSSGADDHDEAVAMMACFSYPPFLDTTDLTAFTARK